MGSPGWQNTVFPLSLLSWPPLFVSAPSISPGRHSVGSRVAYLLVSQCNFPSAALQPELTNDWLVALHSSRLILLKWRRSVRPKVHFPWTRERNGGETEITFSEARWSRIEEVKVRTGRYVEREKWERDILKENNLCMQKCFHKCVI